ncbi:hypothetical protein V6N11_007481 [Hibiscus sabdariffa]|uniref:Uncharacterized protein n=2 Tax=Hibiscus sabdariffa TaxID=183260 RepID=A0ABR2NS74_9ROSI
MQKKIVVFLEEFLGEKPSIHIFYLSVEQTSISHGQVLTLLNKEMKKIKELDLEEIKQAFKRKETSARDLKLKLEVYCGNRSPQQQLQLREQPLPKL